MKTYTKDELDAVLKGPSPIGLSYSHLVGADLEDANLAWADLKGADLKGADLKGANLEGANMEGANLYRATLKGANLRGSDMRGANLRVANLEVADLKGANLQCANMDGANLEGANLVGAKIGNITILKAALFSDLYKYIAMPIISEDGTEYVKLGCMLRTVSEWENNFWNNNSEFPNDGNKASKDRLFTYKTCLAWLKENR